jgi:SulP family sulfate permease
MDLSAQFALEEMIERLSAQSIAVRVVVPPAIHQQLLRLRAPQLPAGILRDDLETALAEARSLVTQPG